MRNRSKLAGAIAALVLMVALVAGCGSGSSTTSGGSTGGSAAEGTTEGGGSSSDYLSGVEKHVETLLSTEGTSVEKPTTSPVRAGGHHKIALISCGQQAALCARGVGAAEEAAHKLGWTATLFDAKLNPPSAATGIRQAIAAGDDGIFVFLVDCTNIKSALEEAKNAGIAVVAGESRDCDETNPGSPPLFTYSLELSGGLNVVSGNREFFGAAAEYAIDKYDGESKALAFFESTANGNLTASLLEEAYAKCSGCSLEMIRFPPSAYGTRLQGIAEQELLKHPEVNTVVPAFEATALEVYPAVRASGKSSEILTFVGEGNEGGMDLIREDANGYAVPFNAEWEGYGGIDALGRLFLGQKPVPIGQGFQLIDAEHNLPKSGPAASPIDFKAMYEKAWKLK
ncbi:MAG TPA: substrate-binding domain-containing protein [Solirubrobacterales bacterium]|nr:substrate-binding domain-containing protein [Solirubrobacterales bacterium]